MANLHARFHHKLALGRSTNWKYDYLSYYNMQNSNENSHNEGDVCRRGKGHCDFNFGLCRTWQNDGDSSYS